MKLASVGALLFVVAVPLTVDAGTMPALKCVVITDDGGEATPSVRTGNRKALQLEVILSTTGESLDDLRVVESGQLPKTLFVDTMMIGGTPSLVPNEVAAVGGGIGSGQSLIFSLVIPDSSEKRQESIRSYLARAASAAEASVDTKREAKALKEKPEIFAAALERLYVGQRPGSYEITCRYKSQRPGFWNGEVKSAPIRLEVIFEGDFFDQPEFQL